MGRRSSRKGNALPAPYLKRVWLDKARVADASAYPFCLPLFLEDFELQFTDAITIFVGENGVGKSTLIEGIAAMAGFDEAGGGKGYRPMHHSEAIDRSGAELADALRAAWLPKVTTGWFFKAETFFSVARYLDEAAKDANGGPPPPDFLSHSHGEGFLRFFEERCSRQGLYFFDEPESALSPSRQLQFLKVLRRMEDAQVCQVIMATHSPILMAYPGARLLQITRRTIEPVALEDTDHYRLFRDFCTDPAAFVAEAFDAPQE